MIIDQSSRSLGPTSAPVSGALAPGTVGGRFTLLRPLGSGAFGAVYEAFDAASGGTVALKRLTRAEPEALYRFKREFRALAGITHPNLVKLRELIALQTDWFLVMEMVSGLDFAVYVRGVVEPGASVLTLDDEVGALSSVCSVRRQAGPALRAPLDLGRLRSALPQVASGLHALHAARRVHRDLKPSNVLVTHQGRAVILDLGLVLELDDDTLGAGEGRSSGGALAHVTGTPAYMAPEQATGGPVGPAADWYALGTLLYEALCGRVPFSGAPREVLRAKCQRPPRDPRLDQPHLPDDLVDLALALLQADPAARPGGDEVLARLRKPGEPAPPGPPASAGVLPFVGRAEELSALAQTERESRRATAIVQLSGPSGMGKTALAERQLGAARRAGAVVLAGRCHERESVPYKALDGVVDSLVRWLLRAPATEAPRFLPRHPQALSRVFPVFAQISSRFLNAQGVPELSELEQRRRGFAALREMLCRIGDTYPLIIHVDDLQWGDEDSAAALAALFAGEDSPPCLFVASFRDDGELGPAVRALRQVAQTAAVSRVIELGPLDLTSGMELARRAWPGAPEATLARLVSESEGRPYFLLELIRSARAGNAPSASRVAEILESRITQLDPGARDLLNVLAIADEELPEQLAFQAAGLSAEDGAQAVRALVHASFARHGPDVAGLETSHDQVREANVALLPPTQLRAVHSALANALRTSGECDPVHLSRHLRGAEDWRAASIWEERAGDAAFAALAHSGAVNLYKRAHAAAEGSRRTKLEVKLGNALAAAGRGAEAAGFFMSAAQHPDSAPDHTRELSRRAGEQLLCAGHVEAGLTVLRPLLREAGVPYYPGSTRRALLALSASRLRLGLRGRAFTARSDHELDQRTLTRVDACWSAGIGLAGVDLLWSVYFQTRHLHAALDAGDPYRVARALSVQASMAALEAQDSLSYAHQLRREAEAVALSVQHPHASAWPTAAGSIIAWSENRLRESADLAARAVAQFRGHSADISWYLTSMSAWFYLPALYYLGDAKQLYAEAPRVLAETVERGDRYGEVSLRSNVLPRMFVLMDRPDEARHEVEEALRLWAREGWDLQHVTALLCESLIDLYQAEGERAYQRYESAWPAIEASLQFRNRVLRALTWSWRGRVALAAAARCQGKERAVRLRVASHAARRLGSETATRWAEGFHLALSAMIRKSEGGHQEAFTLLQRAVSSFEALEMPMEAASCAVRAAELLGAREAFEARSAAELALTERGVANPAKLLAALLPG